MTSLSHTHTHTHIRTQVKQMGIKMGVHRKELEYFQCCIVLVLVNLDEMSAHHVLTFHGGSTWEVHCVLLRIYIPNQT